MKHMDNIKCPVCDSENYKLQRRKNETKRNGLEIGFCVDCTLAYTKPLIIGNEDDVGSSHSSITNADFYSALLRDYETQSLLAKKKAPLMLSYWRKILGKKPISILEIGCGTGQYYEAWKELDVKWTGIEVNKQMLDFCASKKIPVKNINLMEEGIEEQYDVVFLSQVLEHIITPNAFLMKVRELLLNGGILHIDVPNHNSIISLLRKINPFQKDYGFIQPNHHLIAYTDKSLSYLLKQNKFKICQLRAYENNHDTFGQLIVRTGIINNLFFFISRVTKRGSLLVAIATKE